MIESDAARAALDRRITDVAASFAGVEKSGRASHHTRRSNASRVGTVMPHRSPAAGRSPPAARGVACGSCGCTPSGRCATSASALRTPWLGLFGDLDKGIPVEDVLAQGKGVPGMPAGIPGMGQTLQICADKDPKKAATQRPDMEKCKVGDVKESGNRVTMNVTDAKRLVLQHLATHPGKVVLHTELLTKVWGPEYRDDLQYLRVWISRVRRKLGAKQT